MLFFTRCRNKHPVTFSVSLIDDREQWTHSNSHNMNYIYGRKLHWSVNNDIIIGCPIVTVTALERVSPTSQNSTANVVFLQIGNTLRRCCEQAPDCECNTEDDNSPVLLPSPTEVPLPELPGRPLRTPYWVSLLTWNIHTTHQHLFLLINGYIIF